MSIPFRNIFSRSTNVALLLITILFNLSGCGIKGPLYLPQVPQARTQPEATGQTTPPAETASQPPIEPDPPADDPAE